jgi:hypothetical protein
MTSLSEIPVSGGRVALVSPEDYAALSSLKWYVSKNGYARHNLPHPSGTKHCTLHMHQEVMRLHGVEIPSDMEIDHKNRNGLDNRFENLRLCTRSQNVCNEYRENKHGFRGIAEVSRSKGQMFIGRVKVNGRQYQTKSFFTIEEAARARDDLAKQLQGEFAALNF